MTLGDSGAGSSVVDSMAGAEEMIRNMESATMMLEQLGKTFAEMESQKESSSWNKIRWEDIREYFHNLERSLQVKLDQLNSKEKAFQEKRLETHALVAEREASVSSKEHASLTHLQELRDAAVCAITEAWQKHKLATPEPIFIVGNKEKKVSASLNDHNAPIPASEEKIFNNAPGDLPQPVSIETKVHPELKQLCEQMNAKDLQNYVFENRKNPIVLRQELSVALKYATEPARLVLDSLEGFYPLDQSNLQGNEDNSALQGLRRSCLVMMESAASLFGRIEAGDHHPVNSEIKQQAKAIADEWKAKLANFDLDASNGYSLEAQAFLQLLATFSIAEEFDEDELCQLVIAVSARRQAPELCRTLGLTQKMPGVIGELVNRGRQIDAVHFVHGFQLSDDFPPVPLLKEYLTEMKKSQDNGNAASVTQDLNAKELGALKTVIKCIQDYKLNEDYPLEPLLKRVAELEKAKSVKKRTDAAKSKFQSKRPREAGGYTPRKHVASTDKWQGISPAYDERRIYAGGAARYSYVGPPTYKAPITSTYIQQPNDQRAYYYSDVRAHPSQYGAASNYGNYVGSEISSSSYASYVGNIPSASSAYGSTPSSSTYGSYTGTYLHPSNQSYM